MGINGLLQLLKPVIKTEHIKNYRGKKVAVDTYGWIHKACYGYCLELCETDPSTLKWVNYCLSFLDMLLSFDVEVCLVFDGRNLISKRNTEQDRALKRKNSLEEGRRCLSKGDKNSARIHLAKAVDITPHMASQLIKIVRTTRPNVKFIVAPYEADAQLAYLSANMLVDAVISEDADMIPYGCKEILFKLDREGNCERLRLADIFTIGGAEVGADAAQKKPAHLDFRSFDQDMLLCMCIFAGCDYLASRDGMGIKTSYKYVSKHRTADRILRALRLEQQIPMKPVDTRAMASQYAPSDQSLSLLLEYELEFHKAFLTFRHQTVFDPIARQAVPLTPLDRETVPRCVLAFHPQLEFLGESLDPLLAVGIASAEIDPTTSMPFPDTADLESHESLGSDRRPKSVSFKSSGNVFSAHKRSHTYSGGFRGRQDGRAEGGMDHPPARGTAFQLNKSPILAHAAKAAAPQQPGRALSSLEGGKESIPRPASATSDGFLRAQTLSKISQLSLSQSLSQDLPMSQPACASLPDGGDTLISSQTGSETLNLMSFGSVASGVELYDYEGADNCETLEYDGGLKSQDRIHSLHTPDVIVLSTTAHPVLTVRNHDRDLGNIGGTAARCESGHGRPMEQGKGSLKEAATGKDGARSKKAVGTGAVKGKAKCGGSIQRYFSAVRTTSTKDILDKVNQAARQAASDRTAAAHSPLKRGRVVHNPPMEFAPPLWERWGEYENRSNFDGFQCFEDSPTPPGLSMGEAPADRNSRQHSASLVVGECYEASRDRCSAGGGAVRRESESAVLCANKDFRQESSSPTTTLKSGSLVLGGVDCTGKGALCSDSKREVDPNTGEQNKENVQTTNRKADVWGDFVYKEDDQEGCCSVVASGLLKRKSRH